MGAMKEYFDYCLYLSCGLPSITLEGTLDDWKNLRMRIERLRDYGKDLLSWYEVLVPILDEFIKTYQGQVNKDFWNRICHKEGGGSGPSYLSGWIIAFIPFNKKGKYILNPLSKIEKYALNPLGLISTHNYGRINTKDIPQCAVEVPLEINDNGTSYKMSLYAGSILSSYNDQTNQIQPSFDWALIDHTS